MLTASKAFSAIASGWSHSYQRLANWWWLMSDAEQRRTIGRAVGVSASAFVAVAAVGSLTASINVKHANAEFRADVAAMADKLETRAPTTLEADVSLLSHPWMRAVEYALERDPEETLTRYGKRYRDLAAVESFASFEPRHYAVAEGATDEHRCLSEAIFYEARSESVTGQMAVAEVIYNRVRDHRYPNSVCEVVYQGSERTTGCQFSFTCDGSMNRGPRGWTWDRAQTIASHVMMGLAKPQTGNATHYHTDYVDPVWNKQLVHTETIGTHIFYRFPQGREWLQVRQRNADRAT